MNQQNAHPSKHFDTEGSIFMGAKRSTEGCNIGLFGVPYDGTTSFRPGARFGPATIREVSNGIETYCPQLNLDLEQLNYVDLGSLKISLEHPEAIIKRVKNATDQIINLGLKPLMLGGEHSITAGAIESLTKHHSDLILLQLDAHADLRETWQGTKHSHACAMRRCLDILPNNRLFQLGIRSGTREEFQELQQTQRLLPFKSGDQAKSLAKALKPIKDNPIYLTLDLDWFDPSVIPGTGTPEPGGYTWHDFSSVINVLSNHQLVGADIVELAPQLDPSGISSIVAAKATRSLIMLLS